MVLYEELALPQLLTLIAFLGLLQLARKLAAATVGAGLLGECAIGVIFGSPLAGILPLAWEEFSLALGYLGLVLILLDGGLRLNARTFLPNLPLGVLAAVVGIGLPIGFTFALFASPAYRLPKSSAFAAGSALASTSLGTTFAVIASVSKAQGIDLGTTRCGSILSGAAVFDDVIALALLAVLTSLGAGGASGGASLAWLVVRPLLSSAVMAAAGPLVALYLARPVWRRLIEPRLERLSQANQDAILLSSGVLVLSAFLAIATYVRTTVLFGAFLAGVFLTMLPSPDSSLSFLAAYETYVHSLQAYVFEPLFFASVGFTIPFLSLWTGARIWKGVVYALLMLLGKLLVGAVLIVAHVCSPSPTAPEGSDLDSECPPKPDWQGSTADELALRSLTLETESTLVEKKISRWDVTESVPPAALLGFAMVSRGEIGVLVLQAVRSFEHPLIDEEAYLMGIWAVTLCTIVGPIAVSLIVKGWGTSIARGRWGGEQSKI